MLKFPLVCADGVRMIRFEICDVICKLRVSVPDFADKASGGVQHFLGRGLSRRLGGRVLISVSHCFVLPC
jgi:hypothetical protein